MKHAILTSKSDAGKLQADDDTAAHMPWPGVYLDGSPAPVGQGVTRHLYDVQEHPSKDKWAYPVDDEKDLKGKGAKVDNLPADWEPAVGIAAPDEKPTKAKVKTR